MRPPNAFSIAFSTTIGSAFSIALYAALGPVSGACPLTWRLAAFYIIAQFAASCAVDFVRARAGNEWWPMRRRSKL